MKKDLTSIKVKNIYIKTSITLSFHPLNQEIKMFIFTQTLYEHILNEF